MKNLFLSILILVGLTSAAFGQVTADFYGTPLDQCNPPYEVSFYNLSAGDTSLLWDFGDGNTSALPQPNHLYMTTGTFTVTLIAYGVGGSDTLVRTNYVQVNPPIPNPTVAMNSATVSCGGSAKFGASGGMDLRWYDNMDNLIARGDTLNIASVTTTASYFVRSEMESAPAFTGPVDPDSVGGGGYFNGNQGLEFEVLGDIRLKSVLVDAGSAGIRDFTITDTFGIPLQIISVFIPEGKSRVKLDIPFIPGNYVITGDGADLFRNNNSTLAYPYTIPGMVSITGSTVNPNFYYFFYDWEVVTFCQSGSVQVDVTSMPIAAPTTTTDTFTVNCGDAADLVASSTDDVQWFDRSGNLVSLGDTFAIPFAGGSSSYTARSIAQNSGINVGPADGAAIGTGVFHNSPDDSWLYFDVYSDMTLETVLVAADTAGSRDIEVIDNTGTTLLTQTVTLAAGANRILLNQDFTPGSYLIGGSNLGLLRNNSTIVNYPFSIPGTVVITGSSAGDSVYNYFYDWEVSTTCVSADVAVALNVLPPAGPVVAMDSLVVNCDANAMFTATGSNVTWYDANDNVVTQGNTLSLNNVTSAVSYFARNVDEGNPELMDPVDADTLGGGGYHGNAGAFLEFEALSSIRIKSVWVDAGSAGDRDIELLDANDNVLQTLTVNIPAGVSRVTLDLEVGPGMYSLGGANMDLFRNNDGPYYPFTLAGLVNITGSSANDNFYYYLYNWEIVSLCRSDRVPVAVDVLPLANPTITAVDSVCYEEQATFTASSSGASWYDPNGDFIGTGQTLTTPPLTVSGTYSVVGEGMSTLQSVGPVDNTIGGGGYFNGDQGLEFTVFAPMRLNSVWVDAETDGIRDIELEDAGGTVIQTLSLFIPAGTGRIGLGLTLQPGDYTLRGNDMALFRNNGGGGGGGFGYPFEIQGLVSITSSTVGNGFYYFFYDWEVQELPCTSDPVTFDVFVTPEITPSFTFNQDPTNLAVTFTNNTAGATAWNWNFGDGGSSTSQNPTHSFISPGFFVITLDVSVDGCEGSITDTIRVEEPMVGIYDLLESGTFQLYPNPGTGSFVVEATALNASLLELHVFDLTGREVFATSPERTTRFRKEVNLRELAAGSYMVQLKVDGVSVMKKYVMMK